MRSIPNIALLVSLGACVSRAPAVEEITFPSEDGLVITADLYIQNTDPQTPFIVCFHQASWSRGEYNETAPRLNAMGFNCMAIDQRSGGSVNGVSNETRQRASAAGMGTSFVDAIPDLLAAIAFAKANHSEGDIIGMGSSYSSALILKLAGDDPTLVDGVASFSPGEYFVGLGQPSNWIRTSAANIEAPVFISSRKDEQSNWLDIFNAITSTEKVSFLPSTSGQHGSRALWSEFSDSEAYWDAYEPFLAQWITSLSTYRAVHGMAPDGSEDLISSTGDGVSNLLKYALGISPDEAAGAALLPAVVEIEGDRFFEFERIKNRTDIGYAVETNTTLEGAGWRETWSSESNAYGGGTASSERVRVPISQSEGDEFWRLRVWAL